MIQETVIDAPGQLQGSSALSFPIGADDVLNNLTPAEEKLLLAATRGERCEIGHQCPDTADNTNRIRNAFIRFLLTGGDNCVRVHEKGIQLRGAYIEGDIDLECATVCPMAINCCHIAGRFIGRNAAFAAINLDGSHLQGIDCDMATVAGDALFRDGFVVKGSARFRGAEIKGQFICRGGTFENPAEYALFCNEIKVLGSAYIDDGFTAEGAVYFCGADIGRDLCFSGGTFRCPNWRIGRGEWRDANYAINLGGAKVHGTLWLSNARHANWRHVAVFGSINLKDVHAERFRNHPESWPPAYIVTPDQEQLRCVIELDGFVYERLGGGSPTDSIICRRWLCRQPPQHLGKDFRPQPFEQLIKVLRAMGHARDARDIGYFKEFCRLRRPWDKLNQKLNPVFWLWWAIQWLLLEKGLGYGYRPHRMVIIALVVLLGCGYIYGTAAEQGLFAPTNARLFLDGELKADCSPINGTPGWTNSKCQLSKRVPEYTNFNPYIYSLDVILPIVSLRQKDDWQPLHTSLSADVAGKRVELSRYFIRGLVWFETVFAWIWSLSLSAVATGLIKRD